MALERSSRRIARRYHSLPVGRENHIGNSLEGVWRAILRGCTSCRMARYLSNDGSTGCQRSGTRENTNVRKSFPFYPLPVNKTQEDLIGMLLVVWLETPARPEVVGFWIPFFYMDGMIGTSATHCQIYGKWNMQQWVQSIYVGIQIDWWRRWLPSSRLMTRTDLTTMTNQWR